MDAAQRCREAVERRSNAGLLEPDAGVRCTDRGSIATPTMDVRLLGPIEARRDDELIELGARKQRAMLAMLALQVGRTVSADHLAEGLWGDEPPASAHKMVQLYVSHLRRLLAGNGAAIVTHGRGYELQLADGDVDAIRFERLVGEGRPREALALWCGEPLCDVADEPFAAPEIRRLDELRLRAAEAAIDADLAAGRHTEVLGELEALVAQEPLREHLHAQRMLALYRSGRQSESLDAYRRARAALVEEIGIEPGGELRRLHDSVLSQDPALDGPVVASQPPRRKIRPPRPPPDRPAPRRRAGSRSPERRSWCSRASSPSPSAARSSPTASRGSTRTRSG